MFECAGLVCAHFGSTAVDRPPRLVEAAHAATLSGQTFGSAGLGAAAQRAAAWLGASAAAARMPSCVVILVSCLSVRAFVGKMAFLFAPVTGDM